MYSAIIHVVIFMVALRRADGLKPFTSLEVWTRALVIFLGPQRLGVGDVFAGVCCCLSCVGIVVQRSLCVTGILSDVVRLYSA